MSARGSSARGSARGSSSKNAKTPAAASGKVYEPCDGERMEGKPGSIIARLLQDCNDQAPTSVEEEDSIAVLEAKLKLARIKRSFVADKLLAEARQDVPDTAKKPNTGGKPNAVKVPDHLVPAHQPPPPYGGWSAKAKQAPPPPYPLPGGTVSGIFPTAVPAGNGGGGSPASSATGASTSAGGQAGGGQAGGTSSDGGKTDPQRTPLTCAICKVVVMLASMYMLAVNEHGIPYQPWCGQHFGWCYECHGEGEGEKRAEKNYKQQCKKRWEKMRADYKERVAGIRTATWGNFEAKLLEAFPGLKQEKVRKLVLARMKAAVCMFAADFEEMSEECQDASKENFEQYIGELESMCEDPTNATPVVTLKFVKEEAAWLTSLSKNVGVSFVCRFIFSRSILNSSSSSSRQK